MKRLLLLLTVLPLAAGALDFDGIVARVGSEVILRSEVVHELQRLGATDDTRFTEVRNEMIERKLILKAARDSGMTMQEWVVENRVREIINKAFEGDRNKLIELLGRQRVSYPEWYQRLKDDLIVGGMRWNVIDKNVTASPAELRREYDENPDRYCQSHSVTLSVIQLPPGEQAKRDTISAQLAEKGFAELGAKVYKDVIPEEYFEPAVAKEINQTPKGTISHWIELNGWSFLIRKDGETLGKQLTFEEAYDKVEARVKEANAKRLYEAWIERLKAETYIKVY